VKHYTHVMERINFEWFDAVVWAARRASSQEIFCRNNYRKFTFGRPA